MKFSEFINITFALKKKISNDFEVKGLSFDSRMIENGFVFFAISGYKQDGNIYIKNAIEKGAKAIITEADLNEKFEGVEIIKVENIRKVMADMSSYFYDNPSSKIKVIGITGTNGKTTISYLIRAILIEAGYKCGLIGTIEYITKKGKQQSAKLTTPDSIEINQLLSDMVNNKMDFCVMEASSIALLNYRVHRILFDVAIFTNLTSEHMDLHLNMENYLKAKKILFDNLPKDALAISNSDDDYGLRILLGIESNKKLYSIDNYSNLQAKNVKIKLSGLEFEIEFNNSIYKVKSKLTGRFNVYNILAAILTGIKYNIDINKILKTIENFEAVDGRFNRIMLPNGACAIIDYSHTSDSLKNAIEASIDIRNCEDTNGRVITIFGCGGDKDKTKRPVMGKIATELSDYVIITSDNPRSEDPELIIDEIKKGIIGKNNFESNANRDEAIKKGIEISKKGDIILICGKGHETYQEIKGVRSHFDDKEEVQKFKELAR